MQSIHEINKWKIFWNAKSSILMRYLYLENKIHRVVKKNWLSNNIKWPQLKDKNNDSFQRKSLKPQGWSRPLSTNRRSFPRKTDAGTCSFKQCWYPDIWQAKLLLPPSKRHQHTSLKKNAWNEIIRVEQSSLLKIFQPFLSELPTFGAGHLGSGFWFDLMFQKPVHKRQMHHRCWCGCSENRVHSYIRPKTQSMSMILLSLLG